MSLKMNENCFVLLFSLQKCLQKYTGKEKTISRIFQIVGSELRQLQEKHLHRHKENNRHIRKMQFFKKQQAFLLGLKNHFKRVNFRAFGKRFLL